MGDDNVCVLRNDLKKKKNFKTVRLSHCKWLFVCTADRQRMRWQYFHECSIHALHVEIHQRGVVVAVKLLVNSVVYMETRYGVCNGWSSLLREIKNYHYYKNNWFCCPSPVILLMSLLRKPFKHLFNKGGCSPIVSGGSPLFFPWTIQLFCVSSHAVIIM